MGRIEKQNSFMGQARIILDDAQIRIFIKKRNNFAKEIRIWRLSKKHPFLSMFNSHNLMWAVYGDVASAIHGWFAKDGDLLAVMTEKIGKLSNTKELKRFLIEVEKICNGEIPKAKY
jgi:hypothetical protein